MPTVLVPAYEAFARDRELEPLFRNYVKEREYLTEDEIKRIMAHEFEIFDRRTEYQCI